MSDLLLTGWRGREAVAEEFGVSPSTIRVWEHKGLPFIKVGKVLLYPRDGVVAWLEQHMRNVKAKEAETAT